MKKYYLPGSEPERVIWLNNFADKLPGYAMMFNITAVEIADVDQARTMYAFIINQSNARKTDMKNVNEYKNLLSYAPIGTPIGPVPMPEIAMAPAAVPSGIFT
ncbi:MAG: hypothetical protein K9J06_14470, partial [Flavobacteriales bacterium]|nr:hypothetical protein [Flavobacteriales bacterium]